jgi:hypothetical protein
MLNGYVLPFGDDGQPQPGLTFSETVSGTCFAGGYVDHPDSVRCGWGDYIHNSCFKAPGPMHVGDVVLCPEDAGSTSFLKVKLSKVNEPLD